MLLLNGSLQINITPNSLRPFIIPGETCRAVAVRLSEKQHFYLRLFQFQYGLKFLPIRLCPKLIFSRYFEEIDSTIFALTVKTHSP